MTKFIQRFRAFFASEAKTVGLSPKALAPFIAAAIAAILNRLFGLSPADIGGFLHVGETTVVGGEFVLATAITAWLLGPGTVVVPPPSLTEGNDARLSPEATEQLK